LRGSARLVVKDGDTAAAEGSGAVPVLATPHLLALMEEAAVAALSGAIPPGQTSVGVKAELEHLAATPVGMKVTAMAELTAVEGRRLTFTLEAHDAVEIIGRGRHERVLVDEARFLARTEQKKAKGDGNCCSKKG